MITVKSELSYSPLTGAFLLEIKMLQAYYQVKNSITPNRYKFILWSDTLHRYPTFDKLTSVWDHKSYYLIGEVDNA